MSFKEYTQDQAFLLPMSLQDFVPEGHIARVISAVVEELDLKEICSRYSELGCAAYHPRMMVKVLFYAYATGERSSRVIAHKLSGDIAYMYLAGMQRPDFRTINRFRKEHIDLLQGLFVQVVRLCVGMGMVSVGLIAMDSTKIKANASYRQTKGDRFLDAELKELDGRIAAILRESEETDNREDREHGEAESPYEAPAALKDAQALRDKLARAKEQLQKQGVKELNLTDPDAMTMLHRQHRREPSYNGQAAVEGKSGIIVAASLTNDASDYEALKELTEQTGDNVGAQPSSVVADAGYSSYDNLEYLEGREIDGYIPDQWQESLRKGTRKNPEYDKGKFTYHEETDTYQCPMGKELPYHKVLRRQGKPDIRVYRGVHCGGCEKRPQCTKGSFRTVSRDPREPLMQRMRTRLLSSQGRELYAKRKTMIEPVFGDMKQNRRFREFLLRGLRGTRGEFLLMCITHNLRKIANYLRGKGNITESLRPQPT